MYRGVLAPHTWFDCLQVATTLGAGVTTVAVALLIVFRRPWAILFTNDTAIIENLVVVIIPLGISLVGEMQSRPPPRIFSLSLSPHQT